MRATQLHHGFGQGLVRRKFNAGGHGEAAAFHLPRSDCLSYWDLENVGEGEVLALQYKCSIVGRKAVAPSPCGEVFPVCSIRSYRGKQYL